MEQVILRHDHKESYMKIAYIHYLYKAIHEINSVSGPAGGLKITHPGGRKIFFFCLFCRVLGGQQICISWDIML